MKDDIFPPGGFQFNECNLWRETSFALHLIKQAENPRLGLKNCIQNWKSISKKLSENPRSRKTQAANLSFLSKRLWLGRGGAHDLRFTNYDFRVQNGDVGLQNSMKRLMNDI